jgi:hypothetical protein
MNAAQVLRRITAALDDAKIEYMLTGSFASAYHGAPRSTQDIDFVIEATPEQLGTLVQALPEAQYYVDLTAAIEAHKRQSMFNLIDLDTGWKVDFVVRKSRPFSKEEFTRRRRVILHGISIFVASVEDVIIAKLEWSRLAQSQRQIEDVAAILRVRFDGLDRGYVEKWIEELGLNERWSEAQRVAALNP